MKFSKIATALILALSAQVHAEKVNINFSNLSVNDFVKMVGKITGKNILIDGEIKGKINFVANKKGVEKDELIPLLNAILETKKMTLVNKGSYYQVVKSIAAAGGGLPVVSNLNSGGRTMKTMVFQLANVNAAVIRTKIKPLLHKSAKIVSFKKNNLLSITAYPSTLRSIKALIDKIENKQAKDSQIVKLQNARVKDIFPNIQSMSKSLFPQDIISEKVDVMQDITGNAIILVGKASNVARLERYIRELDLEGEGDIQKMHVIALSNSNVEEMEKILSKIVPQMTGTEGPGGAVGKGGKPVPKAVIASDIERNALIVLANAEQYQNILDTVQQLDVEKSQVYIQAKIVEVNTNLAENIGVKYGLNGGAITSNGLFSLAANAGAPALALSSSLLGFLNGGQSTTTNPTTGITSTTTDRAFEFGSIDKVFALGAQLDLLKQNGAAQILSKPSVLSTNNKESVIYVGRTQSILTQAQQSTQGSSSVINNYSREDIGITLKVKPRLSSNNKVSLEIETTIEDILPGSGAASDRPTTTKRSVKTNAIINHAETIILGGLIKSADGNAVTKIPILGDIPILGKLFTSRGDSNTKVNVVIYITPYIVAKSSDLTSLRVRLAELDSIQQQYNKIIMAQLEEESGESSSPRHETFSGVSSRSNASINEDAQSMTNYQPVIEKTHTRRETFSANPVVSQPVVTTTPIITTPTPSINNAQDDTYVRSESIMDTFNKPRTVDLNSLNTGVEYNEGVTFSNTQSKESF